ncbi:hypothetical protein CEXT_576521 [Caerostris extrusa]|uniref:Uncharacterized protein n=1 Tax=Caerostris extrusa TaxID=172846 RepID=A0AAV4Q0P1_CAEEX|nr:hypothetical protein CEXT_576521 [Caerostris extrusa]
MLRPSTKTPLLKLQRGGIRLGSGNSFVFGSSPFLRLGSQPSSLRATRSRESLERRVNFEFWKHPGANVVRKMAIEFPRSVKQQSEF